MKYTNTAMFTDIHFGRKNNSQQHNEDCLNFIKWFCKNVKKDQSIDSIVFLGDYFENRTSVNVATLDYAYRGAKMLNDLDIPVWFITGNHDLFHRNTRQIYTTISFSEFSNFTIIDTPTVVKELGDGSLICPYLFHDEYDSLQQYSHLPVWFGHFDFKGFSITGYNTPAVHGINHTLHTTQKKIFSGHYHKRQQKDNIVYIGNSFPMDMGDAGDTMRGMAIYNHKTDNLQFLDWEQCPTYHKVKLSELVDNPQLCKTFDINARVDCLVDITISFDDSIKYKKELRDQYQLREIVLTESRETINAISDTDSEVIELDNTQNYSIDELVIIMLNNIKVSKINNNLLIDIWNDIKIC